jgi:hypothetical protein
VSQASDVARGEAIIHAIARRLQSVALTDPALQAITFTVHLRAGGGWPRAITMRLEVVDEMQPGTNGHVDACGPTRRN